MISQYKKLLIRKHLMNTSHIDAQKLKEPSDNKQNGGNAWTYLNGRKEDNHDSKVKYENT